MIKVYIAPDDSFIDGWIDNIIQQTPDSEGVWETVEIVRDMDNADYQIALNSIVSDPDDVRTVLFTHEPPCLLPESRWHGVNVYAKYSAADMHLPQRWGFSHTYDCLAEMEPLSKTEDLTWIVSNKGQSHNPPSFRFTEWYRRVLISSGVNKYQYKHLPLTKRLMSEHIPGSDFIFKLNNGLLNYPTDGHIVRMDFFDALVDRYPDILDLYGYGTWDDDLPYFYGALEDRWNGLESYRYALAIHNYRGPNYFNKVTEPFLAWCMPITWGCTNLDEFFPEDSYVEIDIEDENAPERVKEIVESDRREENLDAIAEARQRILDEYQFWPTVERCISDIEADDPV